MEAKTLPVYIEPPTMLSRRDLIALEFAKIFLAQGWEGPLTEAVKCADALIAKLDGTENET
jgi:hypothetical protein